MRDWIIWLLGLLAAAILVGIEYTRARRLRSGRVIAILLVVSLTFTLLGKLIDRPTRKTHIPTATEIADTISIRQAGCTHEEYERLTLENSILRVAVSKEQRRGERLEFALDSTCIEMYRRSANTAFENGLLLLNDGQFDSAKTLFFYALDEPRLGPYTKAVVLHFIGSCDLRLGNIEEAIHFFRLSLLSSRGLVPAWANMAEAYMQSGEYNLALHCLDEALSYDYDHGFASLVWCNRGLLLDQMKEYEEALVSYDSALVYADDSARVFIWNNRACTLKELGETCEALASLDSATSYDPDCRIAWKNKGDILLDIGSYGEAESCFETALQQSPKDVGSWIGRAKAQKRRGLLTEAKASYDSALALDAVCYAWSDRGDVMAVLSRTDEAIANYDNALRLGCDPAVTWRKRGIAQLFSGDTTGALSSFDSAISYAPSFGMAWEIRSIALMMKGDFCGAAASFDSALQHGYKTEAVSHGKGEALILCGRVGEAQLWLEELMRTGQGSPFIALRLGFAQLALSQYCEALAIADFGVDNAPWHYGFSVLRSAVLELMPDTLVAAGYLSPIRPLSETREVELFSIALMEALAAEEPVLECSFE